MKLYTEQVLRNSMLSMITYIKVYNESVIDKIVENHIHSLTPIELPSDEDVEQHVEQSNSSLEFDTGFKYGAEWMRDKIINNK